VQHFVVNETQSAEKKMLHLVLAVADQSKNRLDTVIFSRFGELSDEFLGDLLAAIRRVNPDYFNPTLWRRVIRTQIHRPPQHKPTTRLSISAMKEAQWGPHGLGDFNSLVPIRGTRYSGLALLQANDRR
jgi:hypothetical protein